MGKLWWVVKAETSSALETFAQWVESEKHEMVLKGVRIMTSVDCHRPGEIVFLVETGERNMERALVRDGKLWEGSLLKLDDFDYLLGHSKELFANDPAEDAAARVRKTGEEVLFPVAIDMYVVRGSSMYELRQMRFRAQYLAGVEHPHDVCALTQSLEEMQMLAKHFDGADFSAVQVQV